MKWTTFDDGPLALDLTLQSGQVFHWEKHARGYWEGLIGNVPVRIAEQNGGLLIEPGREELVHHYFALDHPLEEIYATFPKNPLSMEALEACRGMRIIRQPRWECLATFITSSMKQVAHIRAMSLSMRDRFGKKIPGFPLRSYPVPEAIASSSESALRDCGLGYRAKNLLETARWIAEGKVDLDALALLDTPTLRCELERLPGVGGKVANCILLFAYERLEAVPIDVWIHRVLLVMRRGRAGTPRQLALYAQRRFGSYGGYVQQYLFHHARVSRKLKR